MGLDMTIYRYNKDKFLKKKSLLEMYNCIDKSITSTDDFKVFKDRMKGYDSDKSLSEDEYKDKITELKNEYNDRFKDGITKLNEISDQIYKIDEDRTEVGYWGKFWFLHNFLCSVCGNCPNCEDTILTKEHIKTIIDRITEAIIKHDLNVIGEYTEYSCIGDIWDELNGAKEIFQNCYDNHNDEYIYVYLPWW